MVRLTREVRFNLPVSADAVATGGSGHAGTPAADEPSVRWAVRVTFVGEPEPASSYLIDIKEIDDVVRRSAFPVLCDAVLRPRGLAGVAADLFAVLRDAWRGRQAQRVELVVTPQQSLAVNLSEPDMVELSHHFEFSASHRLHNPALSDEQNRRLFGKCNNPDGHGHNYEVMVTIAGEPDENGMLIRLSQLDPLVEEHVLSKVDHKHLNRQVHEFQQANPSVENIAMTIHHWLAGHIYPLRKGIWLKSVTVWETPKTFAEYTSAYPGVHR